MLDTTNGPVILAADVRVEGPARLAGPLYIGDGSKVLGGVLANSSVGPGCKIRGEVQSSVVFGFVNKAHDGFLGHAVVGRWVNLGAMTTNSDLKNNYGLVRLRIRGRTLATGRIKAGCLLGDHVRTGIGTLLTTGTVVEAASSLLGLRMPPRYVPPFSWDGGEEPEEYDIDRFLTRRPGSWRGAGVEMGDGTRNLYRRAFAETKHLRRQR